MEVVVVVVVVVVKLDGDLKQAKDNARGER